MQATYHHTVSDREPNLPYCCLAGIRDHKKTPDSQSHAGPAGGHSARAGELLIRAAGCAHGMHQPLQHLPASLLDTKRVLSPPLRRPWQPACTSCSRRYSSSRRACSRRCTGARTFDQAPVSCVVPPASTVHKSELTHHTGTHALCDNAHTPRSLLLPLFFHAAAIRPCSSSWSAPTTSATAASGRCCSLSHRRWACSSRWSTCSGSCTWQLQRSRSCRAQSTTCEWQQGVCLLFAVKQW